MCIWGYHYNLVKMVAIRNTHSSTIIKRRFKIQFQLRKENQGKYNLLCVYRLFIALFRSNLSTKRYFIYTETIKTYLPSCSLYWFI